MKTYTIIGGVNGVGKSSLSGVLSAENSDLGIIIDTDKITQELGGDKIRGGKFAVKRISDCLNKGINFTQETTLSGVRTLKTIQRAKELGLFYKALLCRCEFFRRKYSSYKKQSEKRRS